MDGGYCSTSGKGGVGVIARDSEGSCVAALSILIPFAQSALHSEAEALKAGLLIKNSRNS